jgi:hypothetical protein
MATSDTPAGTRNCLRCGRALRNAAAVAKGYGKGCWRKVRQSELTVSSSPWSTAQIEDAHLAIVDGAVVPSGREGVFHVVSSDGSEIHLTHRDGCNCVAGLKTLPPRPCWHRRAVTVVLAASGASAEAPAPRAAIALPAAAPATDDVWAALEAVGALDLVPAF